MPAYFQAAFKCRTRGQQVPTLLCPKWQKLPALLAQKNVGLPKTPDSRRVGTRCPPVPNHAVKHKTHGQSPSERIYPRALSGCPQIQNAWATSAHPTLPKMAEAARTNGVKKRWATQNTQFPQGGHSLPTRFKPCRKTQDAQTAIPAPNGRGSLKRL